MSSSFLTFLFAAGAVTLAEMGDKTQLLAMCFATRFSAKKVLAGVFLATVLNHAAAVAAGYFLREVLSRYTLTIQMVAALSFIGFGLWTIRGDGAGEACERKTSFGPVVTVAIAFFIAEMADKTQLATVSLAMRFGNPVAVLIGTTTGMLIADGIGIIIGVVMNKKIPENTLKWISASVFAVCGIIGFAEAARSFMNVEVLVLVLLLIIVLTVFLAAVIVRKGRRKSAF